MVFMQSLTLESATEKSVVWPRLLPRLHVKAFTGGVIVLLFIIIGIIGPSIAPFDPNKQELTAMMKAPTGIGAAHSLGTDNLGRDILSRVIYGSRVSLLVAFAVVFVSGFIGIALGRFPAFSAVKSISSFKSSSRSSGLFHRCCSASRSWRSWGRAYSI